MSTAPFPSCASKRRNVAIAGPVAVTFSHTCRALKVDQQQVATQQIDRWNRRNARKARVALQRAADSLGNGSV